MASKNVTLNLSGRLSFEHVFVPKAGPNVAGSYLLARWRQLWPRRVRRPLVLQR